MGIPETKRDRRLHLPLQRLQERHPLPQYRQRLQSQALNIP